MAASFHHLATLPELAPPPTDDYDGLFDGVWLSADRLEEILGGVGLLEEQQALLKYVAGALPLPFQAVMVMPPFFIGVDTEAIPSVLVDIVGVASVEPQTGLFLATPRSLTPALSVYPINGEDYVAACVLEDCRVYYGECVLVDKRKAQRLLAEVEAFSVVTEAAVLNAWRESAATAASAFANFRFAPGFANIHSLNHLTSSERVSLHLLNHVTSRKLAAEMYIFHAYLSSLDFPFEASFYEGERMRGRVVGVEPLDPGVGVVFAVVVSVLLHGQMATRTVSIEAKNCYPFIKPLSPAAKARRVRGGGGSGDSFYGESGNPALSSTPPFVSFSRSPTSATTAAAVNESRETGSGREGSPSTLSPNYRRGGGGGGGGGGPATSAGTTPSPKHTVSPGSLASAYYSSTLAQSAQTTPSPRARESEKSSRANRTNNSGNNTSGSGRVGRGGVGRGRGAGGSPARPPSPPPDADYNDMAAYGRRVRALNDYRFWYKGITLVHALKLDAVLQEWDQCFGNGNAVTYASRGTYPTPEEVVSAVRSQQSYGGRSEYSM